MSFKSIIKKNLTPGALGRLRKFYENIQITSLKKAVHEQGLQDIYNKLSAIVPDISSQYSTFDINTTYLETKVRAQHAFQISLVDKALDVLKFGGKGVTIVDIGDSSGTHIQYLQGLLGDVSAISVNLDHKAIEKIKGKGLQAIHARAEDLGNYGVSADLFLSFEMLEHLSNPVDFLRNIAEKTSCKGFIITVPFLARSRVGLHHIRQQNRKQVYPENTHIFELSPGDWRLIFQHSGWVVEYEKIYLQYPRYGWLRVTKDLWKKNDFEGFYGAILRRDSAWSKLYQS